MTQNESCDAMPRKRRVRKRPTGVSGLAATLLRDKIAPFDTPQYRRRFGELVAGAVRPVRNPGLTTKNQDTEGTSAGDPVTGWNRVDVATLSLRFRCDGCPHTGFHQAMSAEWPASTGSVRQPATF